MYFNISRKRLFKSKWLYIILFTVITFTSLTVYLLIKLDYIRYGKKVVIDEEKINIQSYYLEYDMTVVSNKNVNTYYMKEWYKKDIGNKLQFVDSCGSVTTIITNKENCYIMNSGNKLNLVLSNIYDNNNITSLATVIDIYLKLDGSCKCSKKIYEKNGEITAYIFLDKNDDCEFSKLANTLNISKLEVAFLDNLPVSYLVYNENQSEYISIVYRGAQINNEIENNVFELQP